MMGIIVTYNMFFRFFFGMKNKRQKREDKRVWRDERQKREINQCAGEDKRQRKTIERLVMQVTRQELHQLI